MACCVTNKTTFIGQDTQLQSPHVKHKWRARHRGRSTRTPRTRNAAALGPSRPRCRGLALLLAAALFLLLGLLGWSILVYIRIFFFTLQAPDLAMRADACQATPRWVQQQRHVNDQPARAGQLQDVASSSHTSGSSGSLPPSLLPCFLHERQGNKEIIDT